MTKLEEDFDKNQKDKASATHPWPKELFIQRMKESYRTLTNQERGELWKLIKTKKV